MVKLTKMKCVACRSDAPQVDGDEMAEYGEQVPDWKIVRREGINRLERNFEFPDFVQAMAFTNQVGVLAEWGRVTVTWWTHKIRGLHRNDFVAAAKTDTLLRS